jgi:hypothetical protein
LNYLEKIKPSYFDLLEPLRRWKILSIAALKEEAEYLGSFSGLYKIVTKLEKYLLIDSFVNTWSNEKFIYLMPEGIKALGENERSLSLNRDLRYHDSLATKVGLKFSRYPFINKTYLDFQIRETFPLLERVPDILVVGKLKKEFNMAIEVELTQKSQDRVKQIVRTYSDSKVVNHILYITDKKSILNSYKKYLFQLGDKVLPDRFLFMYAKDLAKRSFVMELAPIHYKNEVTNLKNIFGKYFEASGVIER